MTDAADRLTAGDEATVRYVSRYVNERKVRFRAVFLGEREQDTSLTFWDPDYGFRSAPADAEVVVHRKRLLPVPKMVRSNVDKNGRTIKD